MAKKKRIEAEDVRSRMRTDSAYATKVLKEFGERSDLCPAEKYVNQKAKQHAKGRGLPTSRHWSGWSPEESSTDSQVELSSKTSPSQKKTTPPARKSRWKWNEVGKAST